MALRANGQIEVSCINSGWASITNIPPSCINVIAMSSGMDDCLALLGDGTAVGWGVNYYGETTVLNGISNLVEVSASIYETVGLLTDGSAVGAVRNYGGSTYTNPPPAGATNLSTLVLAGNCMVGLRRDETVAVWPQSSPAPTNVPVNLTNVTAIASAGSFCLGLVRDPTAPPIPPRIGRPPLGRTVAAGQTAVFNTLSVGAGPLSYQWLRNGSPVAGQTKSSLILIPAWPVNAGDYQLVVTNIYGAATSAVATVTVSVPPPVLQSSEAVGETFQFSFSSALGATYVIEWSASLNPPVWVELERRTGTGGTESVTDLGPLGESRFYRVRVE
jgi:hypothetical protein